MSSGRNTNAGRHNRRRKNEQQGNIERGRGRKKKELPSKVRWFLPCICGQKREAIR